MRIAVVSLFPEMFRAIADYGITARAINRGLVELNYVNPRDYAHDKHQTVDDRPYGGGPGMLMMIQPLEDALTAAKSWAGDTARVVYLSPQGRLLQQSAVMAMAAQGNLILLCGRYEGIDERLIESWVDAEVSVGDYVVSGGELPAMILIDALIRQLPGALGHSESAVQDSFSDGVLDHPHYTRPEEYKGQKVPDVLLSGNHQKIAEWRQEQSLRRTLNRRPELLAAAELDEQQQKILSRVRADSAGKAPK